jgi:predicted nuclease with RNAse H fold
MAYIGVDYGSKLAGTTAACSWNHDRFLLTQTVKNQDADAWILELVKIHQPKILFLDAPLSLPGIYSKLPCYNDFFYRKADQELKAMSPMFLGGLTARAMQLAQNLPVPVIEVYPAARAKQLELYALSYKKNNEGLTACVAAVAKQLPAPFAQALMALEINNWHAFDAVLAWEIGYRYLQGIANMAGTEEEGLLFW